MNVTSGEFQPGTRPTIVMIHGAFCAGWAFDTLNAYFTARGYDCLTPTLRHHGGRPDGPVPPELGTTSMADYAADIMELVDTLPTPPVLMGHSLGGLVAQMVAARRRLAGLVLLAPSPPWGVLPDTTLEFMGAGALYLSGPFWQDPLRPVFEIGAQYTFDRVPPDERRRLFARLVPESGRATFEVLHWPQDPNRTTFVFPRDVTCPVLGLAGTLDQVNAPGTVRRITRRYRNGADFVPLEGMSHWLLTEPGWERMADIIADWLARSLVNSPTASGHGPA